MSDYIEVIAIVEGKTEQIFIESILVPYLAKKKIYMSATQVSKPGQKGGDVRFVRVQKDIGMHLKQRNDTYVTTFVDYYGTKEWPGLDDVPSNATPQEITETINIATANKVKELFTNQRTEKRFIPHMAMHEFEALLFSDSEILADKLNIDEELITNVIDDCGEPEAINNKPETAPSKRLDKWSNTKKFPKTTKGISIAEEIGIDKMREKCPQFDKWIAHFENIAEEDE